MFPVETMALSSVASFVRSGLVAAALAVAAGLPAPGTCLAGELPAGLTLDRLNRFTDLAPELGLDRLGRAGSVVMDDLTGDRLLDVLTCTIEPNDGLRLFRNEGDGSFADVTADAGLAGQPGGTNLVQADVDNDGRIDFLVLRGGNRGRDGEIPNSLFRQVRPGQFRDQAAEAGIRVAAPAQTACFADVDLDGDLDLFVGYETEVLADGSGVRYPGRLWRNRGDGTFDDVTQASGIRTVGPCVGAVFGDYDGDRLPDLYLSIRGGPNSLWRNLGDGTFVDVAPELGVTLPLDSYATWFFDYDNDRDPDLFVAAFDPSAPPDAEGLETPRLYDNVRGSFQDVTALRGLDHPWQAMGANFGDIDNDGYLDIYLGTGGLGRSVTWPNVLLLNRLGTRFDDIAEFTGLDHLGKGQGIAFGDPDDDGDEDVFVAVGGYFPEDASADALFVNSGSPKNKSWICVELEGVTSNRFGLGCRIRVRVREREKERYIVRYVGSSSSFGGSSLREEIGLGWAEKIVMLDVHWPATGETQSFFQPPLNSLHRVREGDREPVSSRRPYFRLGSPAD